MDQTIEVLARGHPRSHGASEDRHAARGRADRRPDRHRPDEERRSMRRTRRSTPASQPPIATGSTGDAKRLVMSSVVPAFVKLRAFFVDTYLPACRETVGAWDLPNGAALYAFTARATHDDEAHARPDPRHRPPRGGAHPRRDGSGEDARRLQPGSLKDFFTFLRTDPRFYFKDGQELLIAYRDLAKRVDPAAREGVPASAADALRRARRSPTPSRPTRRPRITASPPPTARARARSS